MEWRDSLEPHLTLLWNECLSPTTKFICWSPSSWCVAIWRWGLWEVTRFRWGHGNRVPMMGLVPSLFISRGDQSSLSAMWAYSKEANQDWPCRHPDLGLLSSRPVRNKCWLFKPLSLWQVVIATWADYTAPFSITRSPGPCMDLADRPPWGKVGRLSFHNAAPLFLPGLFWPSWYSVLWSGEMWGWRAWSLL